MDVDKKKQETEVKSTTKVKAFIIVALVGAVIIGGAFVAMGIINPSGKKSDTGVAPGIEAKFDGFMGCFGIIGANNRCNQFDYDNDKVVGFVDFGKFLQKYTNKPIKSNDPGIEGKFNNFAECFSIITEDTDKSCNQFDYDNDGIVGFTDFGIFAQKYQIPLK